MIRPDEGKSTGKDLSEIWRDAQRDRSQLLRSRMQWRGSDEDRTVYGKWRRGVIIFYGLLGLFFIATGTMGHIADAKQTTESEQPMTLLKVTRAPTVTERPVGDWK